MNDDHMSRLTRRPERLRRTEHLYINYTHKSLASTDNRLYRVNWVLEEAESALVKSLSKMRV